MTPSNDFCEVQPSVNGQLANASVPNSNPVPVQAPQAPVEKISDLERLSLELSKTRRELAMSQAREAVTKGELADLQYRHDILATYHRNGLSSSDALEESTGRIVRGGAVQQQNGQ